MFGIVGELYARIAARAGIPAGPLRKAHSGRHFYATSVAEDGVPVYALQRQLGHRSSKTTDIYTHHGIGAYVDQLREASPARLFVQTQLSMDAALLPPTPAQSAVDDEADSEVRRLVVRTRLFRMLDALGEEIDPDVELLDHGMSGRELAAAIGIAWGTLSGVRHSRWGIGPKFIDGAVRAFAGRFTYEQLFYEVQE